jgi:cardiolipin synthase
VQLVTRDNGRHPTDIEREYLSAIDAARRNVLIANAYFLPGYRLLRALRRAAQRGVKVTLILQGKPDMPWVMKAARRLYPHLLGAGVHICEYDRRPLHAKLAAVDDEWSTVGSSNLDPLSLSLNLEANVIVRDRTFNALVRQRLQHLISQHCHRVSADELPARRPWRTLSGLAAYHVLRHLPAWAGLWPAHTPKIEVVPPADGKAPP